MSTMKNMPGFTADTSLYKTSGRYQSLANQSYSGGQGVVAQLRAGGGFGTRGLSFHWPSWCEIECAAAAALCIAAWGETIVGVAACLAAEATCLNGCKSSSIF
jgi:hypothetical protein